MTDQEHTCGTCRYWSTSEEMPRSFDGARPGWCSVHGGRTDELRWDDDSCRYWEAKEIIE